MSNIKEKIRASLYLLSYFDTLGFNNTMWEFNYGRHPTNEAAAAIQYIEILHEYFSLGGYTNINISQWNASDDTIMMLATGLGCLKGSKEKYYIEIL